jgi:hypothetical protein
MTRYLLLFDRYGLVFLGLPEVRRLFGEICCPHFECGTVGQTNNQQEAERKHRIFVYSFNRFWFGLLLYLEDAGDIFLKRQDFSTLYGVT